MFNILQATSTDIPAIIEIAAKTWWPTYSNILSQEQIAYMLRTLYLPDKIQEQMTTGSQTYLVGCDEKGMQGFASYGKRVEDHSTYKLHKLYVLPQDQGKGYGTALIHHIRQKLLTENIHALELNVNRYNSALNFYLKSGFKVVREEDVPIGPYWMNDYVLRLEF